MDIKSFGCSFIYGTDLADTHKYDAWPTRSQLTWPSLLAQHLGYGYQCYARPGSGNLQIMERVLAQATNIEPALFVIGWTWMDRFDYIDNNPNINDWPGTPWKTIMPVDTTGISHTYYRDLHSQFQDKLTTLIYIKTVIDVLKQKNYPFIMTYIDDLIFETQWHSSAAIAELQDYVRPHLISFEGLNFLDWSKKNNFPISDTMHPLEQAHRAAGDYIIKVFDTKNTVDH
jgi:hypothetical protein